MINEHFLTAAVNIRRDYLKLTNNMEFYKKTAEKILNRLNQTIADLEALQNKTDGNTNGLTEVIKIIEQTEAEGKQILDLMEPINKEIEKLSIEEGNLYNKIKEHHNNLTDDQIISFIKERLIKEKLV